MGANNIRNSHRIYVGQNLQIPAGGGETLPASHFEMSARAADPIGWLARMKIC